MASSRIMVDSARQVRSATYPVWVYFAVPLLALLVQVYLPLFETSAFHFTNRAAAARNHLLRADAQVATAGPGNRRNARLGAGFSFSAASRMYGICKTLVGYFSASIGMQFDVEHAFVRLVLCFLFYLFHQFFYWVLQRAAARSARDVRYPRRTHSRRAQRHHWRRPVPFPRQAPQARLALLLLHRLNRRVHVTRRQHVFGIGRTLRYVT